MALDYILDLFRGIIVGMRVYPERMKQNMEITRGLLFSQRLMLELIERGVSRDDAYKLMQANSARTWTKTATSENWYAVTRVFVSTSTTLNWTRFSITSTTSGLWMTFSIGSD